MAGTVSERHVLLFQLRKELLRARELEAAGQDRLDAHEKRFAKRKANVRHAQSEKLLDLMRITHDLQASHVRLLEKEVREASGPVKKGD